jgi:quercetin dioxygenase-like cupin family protein
MSTNAYARTYKIAAGLGLADVWWKSGRMTIKADGAQTGGSLAQIETDDPRGTATPRHIHHNEDETFYVLEGEVSLLVDGRQIDLAAGDYAFAPRETTHAYIVRSPRARMLTTLTPAGLEEVFVALGAPVDPTDQPPPEPTTPPIPELARRFGAYGCEVVGPAPTLADIHSVAP